ncbi:MAG: DUF2064 domain-containing protein [Nitrospinae bacterium]|nr:DUF2064 domain-containing protein [Nitrospinota bacterium]
MRVLIIFAKAPVAGQVKTRLIEGTPLSGEQVCGLYEAFLKDVMTVAALTTAETIAVHYAPATGEKQMRSIMRGLNLGARNERRFIFTPQVEGSFTERVAASFEAASKFAPEATLMIGSDAPILKPEIMDSAFDFISARAGMALGPSGEGGVYLIGVPGDAQLDFSGVFTEGSELENLLSLAKRGNMPLKILPQILDVDVEADLVTLISVMRALNYERKFDSKVFPMNTFKAIEELGLAIVRNAENTRHKKIAFVQE